MKNAFVVVILTVTLACLALSHAAAEEAWAENSPADVDDTTFRTADRPDGRWTIVEAAGATTPERTAARELRDYLRRICAEWFEVESEATGTSTRSVRRLARC